MYSNSLFNFCFTNPICFAGDWLMCLNDLEVNLDNLDNILSAITTPITVS